MKATRLELSGLMVQEKSTLLRILAGGEEPDVGKVLV